MLAGIAIGAVAVQALHAQARPKAYSVSEIEVLDAAALNVYLPLVGPAIKAAGGRNFNTAGGRTIAFTGESPRRVAIIEWDSLEQVQAFLNSAAWKNLAPQREKAQKFIRSYAIEATGN